MKYYAVLSEYFLVLYMSQHEHWLKEHPKVIWKIKEFASDGGLYRGNAYSNSILIYFIYPNSIKYFVRIKKLVGCGSVRREFVIVLNSDWSSIILHSLIKYKLPSLKIYVFDDLWREIRLNKLIIWRLSWGTASLTTTR